MEFNHPKSIASFSIPDRPTVREQMAYYSEAALATKSDHVFRMWKAAAAIITTWNCEIFPDKNGSLDTVSDPSITEVLIWAGTTVKLFMNRLDDLPKNS